MGIVVSAYDQWQIWIKFLSGGRVVSDYRNPMAFIIMHPENTHRYLRITPITPFNHPRTVLRDSHPGAEGIKHSNRQTTIFSHIYMPHPGC